MLDPVVIETLASGKGVRRIAVENFLSTLVPGIGMHGNYVNMLQDVRDYKWNAATQEAIAIGIHMAFARKQKEAS